LCLDKLARHFCDLELSDFEPPVGTERLEEFMDEEWGERSARTRAKNISILKGFFEWCVLRGKLHGDPARPIRPPKKRGVERTTFSKDQERAIFAQNDRRDCLAPHPLLKEGIRKAALQAVQFRHFDHAQRRLTVFTKGGKVQTIPIVDPAFWNDLERWILDWEAQPTSTCCAAAPSAQTGTSQASGSSSSTATNQWAATGCTTGGTPVLSAQVLSGKGRAAARGCTRRAIRPASVSSTTHAAT
jgi:hypothetical protein